MKANLNMGDDEYQAFLTYRDTPLPNGYSPAITEHESHTKNSSACHVDELLPKMPDYDELCRREKKYREKMARAIGMTTDTKLY